MFPAPIHSTLHSGGQFGMGFYSVASNGFTPLWRRLWTAIRTIMLTRLALWTMVGVSAIACLLLVLNFFKPSLKMFTWAFGAYFALWILGLGRRPFLVQKFVVQPNELALETPI